LKKLATILTTGLALGTTPGLAQTPQAPATPGPAPAGLITTHATARRRLPNTVADASVSIEAHGRTVAAVQRTLAENSQTLLAFLRQAGTERLRTNALSVSPHTETERPHGLPDRITGYDGSATISFRTSAEKLGDLLSGALEHGANGIGDASLSPREEELDAARQDIAAEATDKALKLVDAVAKAAHRTVSGVMHISIDPRIGDPAGIPAVPSPTPVAMPKMVTAARPSPPPVAVAAGDVEITVEVALTAALDR